VSDLPLCDFIAPEYFSTIQIAAKTQDCEASLKIYQLPYLLPSSLVCWHIKTARSCQHRHIGTASALVTSLDVANVPHTLLAVKNPQKGFHCYNYYFHLLITTV
jgi:hypothetical protein